MGGPMRRNISSKGKPHKKSKMGILIGIPLLLFISGIALVSIGTYNYFKYAYYISRIFIQEDFKPDSSVKLQGNKKASEEKTTETKKITFPSLGDKFGDLIIETGGINVPVIHGDSEKDLLAGVGHYAGSRYPGEGSNIVLAGHRNSVFKGLKDVKKGDKIKFNTTYGNYVYQVSEFKIINGGDKSIVQPTDTEKLTIYTCYPFNYVGNAPKRYVVICDLVEGTPVSELLKAGENK
jgi:sortase A